MTTNFKTLYCLQGVEVLGGTINLNDGVLEGINCIVIGDWTIEVGESGDLYIKNDDIVQAKITSNNNPITEQNKYDRLFMTKPCNIEDSTGLLVCSNNGFYNYNLTQSPNYEQYYPTISLSSTPQDASVLGTIVGYEKYCREISSGAFKTVYNQDDEINRVIVNTKSMGSMWVCDMNGIIKNGDYITSSGIPGYGMKQKDNIKRNYTFAKSTHDCNFNPKTIILKKPIDMDSDGVVYDPITNIEGEPIKDIEYNIRYVRIDGTWVKRVDFQKEIEELSEGKGSIHALKSRKRTIFRCCLIGYII